MGPNERATGPAGLLNDLATLLDRSRVDVEQLAELADVSERTIRRLAVVGLTDDQAVILASVVGERAERVWPDAGTSTARRAGG